MTRINGINTFRRTLINGVLVSVSDMPYQAQIDDYKKGWLSWRELPKSTQFTYKLLNRVKNHTHELSDDNPVKSLAKKYIWAERLSWNNIKREIHKIHYWEPGWKSWSGVVIFILVTNFANFALEQWMEESTTI